MRVGVVGGGITGLALGYHLAERGVDSVALEASDRPGGVIRSDAVAGRVLERGPQRTRLVDPVETLVDELSLRDDLVTGDPSLPMYVYARGSLGRAPFSIREFLTTDLLSWRGKLRVLAEPLTSQGDESEMAADLFARKFGEEAYRNVIGPLFGGIYGSDPAEMPAGYAPSPLLDLERRDGSLLVPAVKTALDTGSRPPITFEEGLETLPRGLYRATADRVHLDRPATGLRADGDGYVLETPDGQERVDRVVLTTPADVSADLLTEVAPDAADRLDRLAYNPLALVSLVADLDREGFGYQVGLDADLRTLGVSWTASLFGRDGLYTAFLGGMSDPEALEMDDDALGDLAAREFREVTGASAEVLDVARLERGFPAWDRTWRHLDGLELPDGVALATNYTARMGIPGRLREARSLAGELADA